AGGLRVRAAGGSFLEVCTGTEHGRRVGEDRGPDVGGLSAVQRGGELADELAREGVAIRRRVERDGGHATFDGAVHEFSHGGDCSHAGWTSFRSGAPAARGTRRYAAPVPVEIRVLGPLEVRSERGAVSSADFRSRKSVRVLEVLALSGGQIVSKDVLIDTLWRKQHPANPAATVEVAVSLLRSVLATITDDQVVVTEPGGYRLDLDVAVVDMLEFDRALAAAEHHPEAERLTMLQDALSAVRGPLLDGEPAADWLSPHRDRARRRVGIARLLLAQTALRHGDTRLAFAAAEAAWTNAEVVLEEAYAIGATALLLDGQRGDALDLVRAAERRLQIEAGGIPGPALVEVRSRLDAPFELQAGGRSIAIDGALLDLPAPLPYLGREHVHATVDGAVHGVVAGTGSVWLHVDGARGRGKTRTLEEIRHRTTAANGARRVETMQVGEGDHEVPLLLAGRMLRLVDPSFVASDDAAGGELFLRLAAALDRAGPMVLLIDDVQWADVASLAVLRSLVAPGGTAALGLVTAGRGARPGTTGTPLLLPLLTQDELAAAGVAGAWAATSGHPLVLAACAAAAAGDGRIEPDGIPPLRAIVGDLGPVVHQVVVLLADKGGSWSVEQLIAMTNVGGDAVSRSLVAAVEAGVVRVDSAHTFTIASPLFRAIFSR
ncbi:MAG: hypothetical protein RJA49_2650, partial [Actinomycetota bacterium]